MPRKDKLKVQLQRSKDSELAGAGLRISQKSKLRNKDSENNSSPLQLLTFIQRYIQKNWRKLTPAQKAVLVSMAIVMAGGIIYYLSSGREDAATAVINADDIVLKQAASRITVSEHAAQHYHANPQQEATTRAKITRSMAHLLSNAKRKCKVQSILSDSDFKIEIVAQKEVGKNTAEYDRRNNKILIPTDLPDDSIFDGALDHEMHHAWVTYENKAMQRHFFTVEGKPVPLATPCLPGTNWGQVECLEIAKILTHGLSHADTLIAIFDKQQSGAKLTPLETKMQNEYVKAIAGYKPLTRDIVLEETLIRRLQSKGMLDANLQPPRKGLGMEDGLGFLRYCYDKIEVRNGKYYAKTRSYTEETLQTLKGPLLDLKYMLKEYQRKDFSDYLKEFDAVVHQLFNDYPAIYNLLFPQLQAYHEEKSDSSYRSCIK